MTDTTTIDAAELCVRSIHLMGDGTLEELAAVIHPDCVNREAKDEPPATRGRGPAAMHATAQWLRGAFAELRWEIHDVIVQGDLVAVHCTMKGRHAGAFVVYGADARPKEAFPPTGREFASTQSHWFRVEDGKLVEHWANRDDLGTAEQLGWVPPTPRYLVRMALAKRRARRLSRP